MLLYLLHPALIEVKELHEILYVRWDKSWVIDNKIPCCEQAKDYKLWINNKDVTTMAQFEISQGGMEIVSV